MEFHQCTGPTAARISNLMAINGLNTSCHKGKFHRAGLPARGVPWQDGRLLLLRSGLSSRPACPVASSQPSLALTMNAKSRRPKPRDGAISSLNAAIDAMNLVKEALSMTPAMAVAGLVSVVLTMTRVCFLPFNIDRLSANIRRIP